MKTLNQLIADIKKVNNMYLDKAEVLRRLIEVQKQTKA